MYVTERFTLNLDTITLLQNMEPEFGYDGFGEFIYYRTYSRTKKDGSQECWADTVIRVIEGILSIRKDWYIKTRIHWDEEFWQNYAFGMAVSLFEMKWMPPGRGLWAMGTDFIYERGAMALYNCAYTDLTSDQLGEDIEWLMDSLMNGVGVGFGPIRDNGLRLHRPGNKVTIFTIQDTRESWCEATRLLIESFLFPGRSNLEFDYSLIRPAGALIKGFGGIASGPAPLMKLHERIRSACLRYLDDESYDSVRFKTDLANSIGVCVVAGNVRRSAEIALGKVNDETFINLKDYSIYPERAEWGWMSNNSVMLESDEDFEKIGLIAERVIKNGEPGYINFQNIKHGRLGKNDGVKLDVANGINPCSEIPLEGSFDYQNPELRVREVCNVVESCPTRCFDENEWYKALEYATFYASTVSLLPTHQPSTNRVVARNRRIGVSIIDFTGWKHEVGLHKVIKFLRHGYQVVTFTNKKWNAEAGIPESIRKTTIKPGGTVPKLVGRTAGAGYPTFRHTLRRVRVQQNSPIHDILAKANVPYEKDSYSDNTDVFEFPIIQGPARVAADVSLWEQASNLVVLQREWADNSVSNTLYFKPKWELKDIIEDHYALRLIQWLPSKAKELIANSKNQDTYYSDDLKIEMSHNPFVIKVYQYNPDHEEDDIEQVIAAIAPLTKSASLLPHTNAGVYAQTPEEGISEDEYYRRVNEIGKIDWSTYNGDGIDEKYCDAGHCTIERNA